MHRNVLNMRQLRMQPTEADAIYLTPIICGEQVDARLIVTPDTASR